MRALLLAVLVMVAQIGGAAAEGLWQPLSGGTLQGALAARTLVAADGRTLGFFQDGRLLLDGPVWAGWRVDGSRLCTSLPAGCAVVARHARGLDLRLTWESGRIEVLRYVDLR